MPGPPTRRIVARTAPRHAAEGSSEGARAALGVIALTLTLAALSYPRGAGAMFVDWLRFASIAVTPLVLLPPRRFAPPPWLVGVFLVWTTLSVLWSQEPPMTSDAVILYAWMSLLAYGAATLSPLRHVPTAAALGLALTITMSVGATLTGYEGPRRWEPWGEVGGVSVFQGLFGNRNILAYTLTMLLPAAVALTFQRRMSALLGALLLAATVAVIGATGSTTSLVTAVAIVAVAVAAPLLRRLRTAVSGRTRGALIATLTLVCVGTVPVVVNVLGGRDLTLSGRVPFWQNLVRVSSERPLTGFGWGTVWNYHWLVAGKNPVRTAINEGRWTPLAHGHNAVLDLLPQIGIVGIAIVITIQVRALVKLTRAPRSATRSWALLTLVAINMIGFTEPTWAIPLGWGLLVVVATVAERLPPRSRPPAPPLGSKHESIRAPEPSDKDHHEVP